MQTNNYNIELEANQQQSETIQPIEQANIPQSETPVKYETKLIDEEEIDEAINTAESEANTANESEVQAEAEIPTAKKEDKESKRKSVDDGFERKLLADYALQTSTGEMDGDSFIEYAISHPEIYPKRIVDRAINKLTRGKVSSYEDYHNYRSMDDQKREQYDSLMDNPVVKEMKEYVEANKKEKEYGIISKISQETGKDLDTLETKYFTDRTYNSVFKSLIAEGYSKELAMRSALKVVDPYIFDKQKAEAEKIMDIPSKPVQIDTNRNEQKPKTSLFSQRYVNPIKDW